MSEHAPPDAPATGPAPAPTSSLGDTVRALVIAASIGAAVIHFAYAPVHFEESTVHGLFFLAMGWVQLGTAFALARWRSARWPWVAAAAISAAIIAVWLVSRTAGVPGSEPEPFGFPDGLASGLEAIVVVGSLLALRPEIVRRPSPRVSPVLGGVVALAMVGLVSASVSPSIVGEHAHGHGGAHGDDHGNAATAAAAGDDHDMAGMEGMEGMDHGNPSGSATVARADRCDLGFNTAAFNDEATPGQPHAHKPGQEVDFTIEQWAKVFADPEHGIPAEAVAAAVNRSPVNKGGILSGGLTHTLAPDHWNPLTKSKDCQALGKQLDEARAVAAKYPTVKDAEAAGYRKVTNYLPGIAAHYMNFDYLRDGFVLEHPEMLLYDGTEPTSHMVGLSYYIIKSGDTEPTEGFVGNNDHYHQHIGLCLKDGVVQSGSNTTDAQCAAQGGRKSSGAAGWMGHLWIVPGCESDWGIFSGSNPKLKVHVPGAAGPTTGGCGTGKPISAPLAFETGGKGPQELASAER
jgi:hypothetical protein